MSPLEQYLRATYRNKSESFYARQLAAMEGAERTVAHLLPPKPAKRIRQDTKPLMNGLELSFLPILAVQYPGCRIIPQAMRVKIANGAWYKVDFFIPAKLEAHEVKGPKVMQNQQSRQLLALKTAAAQWPEISWFLNYKDENNQWQQQRVLA